MTDICNYTKKDIDLLKDKLDHKAEEKKQNLREDVAGYEDDDNGGPDNQQEIIDE